MTLADHIGQNHLKPLILAEIKASQENHRPLRHMIFSGLPGLGKSTLARKIAQEMGGEYIRLDGSTFNPKGVAELLLSLNTTNYTPRGNVIDLENNRFPVIFLDEAHALPTLEPWYIALEEFHVVNKAGLSWVPYFTLISATTAPDRLSKPFTDRCPLQYELLPYSHEELAEIIVSRIPECPDGTAAEVAARSRGVARLALSHARSCLNFGAGYWEARGIDERGLTILDKQYLEVLENAHAPLALQTIAFKLNREPRYIESLVEPYLLQCGLMERTPKGRVRMSDGRGARTNDPSAAPSETGESMGGQVGYAESENYAEAMADKLRTVAVIGGRSRGANDDAVMKPSHR